MLKEAEKIYLRYQRWWKNSAVSVVMWIVGWLLVYLLVTHSDLTTQYSRYSVSLAMTLPTFFIHMRILWRDRQIPFRTGATKWWLFWLFSHFPDMGVNWLMVRIAGWPFLVVYAVLVLPTALYTYWVRNKFVFAPSNAKTETA